MNSTYKKLLSCASILFMHAAHGTVIWSGTSCPDVIDEDIIIKGDCELTNFVTIEASKANVTVYVVDNDAVIRPVSNDPDASPKDIDLIAKYPYTITFVIKKHLTFKGDPVYPDKNLRIFMFDNGRIIWLVEDGGKLSFTADDTSGSTALWNYKNLDYPPQPYATSASFITHHQGQIFFGPRSKCGYFIDYCTAATGKTVIENHSNHIVFQDRAAFALEVY